MNTNIDMSKLTHETINGVAHCMWCDASREEGCVTADCFGTLLDGVKFVVKLEQSNCTRGCCGSSSGEGSGDTLEEAIETAVESLGEKPSRPSYNIYLESWRLDPGNMRELIEAAGEKREKRRAEERGRIEKERKEKSDEEQYLKNFTRVIGTYHHLVAELNMKRDHYTTRGFEKELKELEEDKENELAELKALYPLSISAINTADNTEKSE